jgi:hypothetical protein
MNDERPEEGERERGDEAGVVRERAERARGVVRLGQEREPEHAHHREPGATAAGEEERRPEPEGERDLEDEVRRVTRAEVGEPRVCRDDESIVVHPRERLVEQVRQVEREREPEEPLHRATRRAISETNSTTARSI